MNSSSFLNERKRSTRDVIGPNPKEDTNSFNCSITLLPGELQMLLNRANSNESSPTGQRFDHRSLLASNIGAEATLSAINTSANWKSDFLVADSNSVVCGRGQKSGLSTVAIGLKPEKTDLLFPQFLEVLQGRTNDSEVFDTIQDLIHICDGILEMLRKDEEPTGTSSTGNGIGYRRYYKTSKPEKWLEEELKTWKLLYALFKDRILVQRGEQNSMMDCETIITVPNSEKDIITQLYANHSTLREYQLIIDWLESCYQSQSQDPSIGHTTDRSVAWENTLFQLKRQQEIPFGSGAEIVKSLDPDAPVREKRPLHALDEEDSVRLSRCIFEEIRQGNVDEAMALCKFCGQTWRAAILEGWRLYEDPNYGPQSATRTNNLEETIFNSPKNPTTNSDQKQPIEGNPRRDIWKKCAWMMADSKKFDEYTRAIAGTFCGHLESLKSLLRNSWEDVLWAYLKVQVDIRVEAEIRCSSLKTYHPLPDEYWNNKMSMEQIFEELLVHKDASVRDYAHGKIATIQKHLILDNINDLLMEMKIWIDKGLSDSDDIQNILGPGIGSATGIEGNLLLRNTESANPVAPRTHFVRFLAHIVLFMRQIGRVKKEEVADFIIATYVEELIGLGDPGLIAFYTAALPGKMQVILYSKFLETVQETSSRSAALDEAINASLDVESITRHTVETIRQRQLPGTSYASSSVQSSPPTSSWSGGAATAPRRNARGSPSVVIKDLKILKGEIGVQQLRVGEISLFDSHKIRSLEWLTFLPAQRAELLWQANTMIRVFLAENKIECIQAIYDMVPQDSIAQIIEFYGSKENLPYREDCTIKEYLSYKIYLTALDNFNEWSRLRHQRPKEPESLGNTANFTERMALEHKEQVYRAELNRWTTSIEEQTKGKSIINCG